MCVGADLKVWQRYSPHPVCGIAYLLRGRGFKKRKGNKKHNCRRSDSTVFKVCAPTPRHSVRLYVGPFRPKECAVSSRGVQKRLRKHMVPSTPPFEPY